MMRRPPLSLKARAIQYLSSREHSRLELARKLHAYAQEDDDVEALLDWLEQSKFLSQERFSESLVNRRAGRFGNQRIYAELQTHGIAGEAVDAVRAQLESDEGQRATAVLLRKFRVKPQDMAEKARYMRFMQQRGFSSKAIRMALEALSAAEYDDTAGQ